MVKSYEEMLAIHLEVKGLEKNYSQAIWNNILHPCKFYEHNRYIPVTYEYSVFLTIYKYHNEYCNPERLTELLSNCSTRKHNITKDNLIQEWERHQEYC